MKKEQNTFIISNCFRNNIIAVITISSLVTIGLYFCMFHGSLSMDSKDWADFSTYFTGVLTPILTGVNIFVFIKLTVAIADGDGKAQKERHQNELAFRKRVLIIKNQQYEIRQFERVMNNLICSIKDCNTESDLNKARNECLIAEKYIEQMKKWNTFDLDKIGISHLLDQLFKNISSANQGLKLVHKYDTSFNNTSHQMVIEPVVHTIIAILKNEIISTIEDQYT